MASIGFCKTTAGRAALRGASRFGAGLTAVVLLGLAATPASATLGRSYDSIQADRVRMAAKMASVSTAAYTVHTLSVAGGVVREYADPQGMVFAVAWRAQGRPDLRQLLGDSYDVMQADNVRVGGPRTRTPLAVRRSGLVLQSGGHPGAFWGFAYLPQQTPAGVSVKDMH